MSTTAVTLSIRDRIKVIQTQVVTSALTPSEVRDNLILLTGLFGNVLDEHREADAAYHLLVASYVEGGDAVNRAEIRASTSAQYARAREAKDAERLVLEMIRGAKTFLQSLDTEMRLSR